MPIQHNRTSAGVLRNLQEKTGRTLEEWRAVIGEHPRGSHRETVEWLKREHGLGHVTASVVARTADTQDDDVQPADETLVAAQYSGPRAALRPIHDRLVEAVAALGADVEIDARKTYVALRCPVQFALIQVGARDRVDLGLRLPADTEPTERLRPAGSFGTEQITHRVALRTPDDVDGEILEWLRIAYEDRRRPA